MKPYSIRLLFSLRIILRFICITVCIGSWFIVSVNIHVRIFPCVSTPSAMDIWVVSSVGLLQVTLLWACVQTFAGFHFSRVNTWSEMSESYSRYILNFWRKKQIVPPVPAVVEFHSPLLHFLPIVGLVRLFKILVILTVISLRTKDIDLFMCLFPIHLSSLMKHLSYLPMFNWIVCFLIIAS